MGKTHRKNGIILISANLEFPSTKHDLGRRDYLLWYFIENLLCANVYLHLSCSLY